MGQGSAKNLASISGVTVTGTPTTGQVLTATNSANANWQNPPVVVPGPTVVFKPSGVATENVYVTEASLANAIAAIHGPVTLVFDLSSVAFNYTFTTVGSLNLGSATAWTDDFPAGTSSLLTFANGTTLPNPPISIGGNLGIFVSQATAVCTLGAGENVITTLSNATGITSTSGFFVDATSASWTVWMYGLSQIGGGTASNTTGPVQLYLSDAVSVLQFAGTIGSVAPVVFSPGIFLHSSFYPNTTISGLLIDQTGNAVTTIPPSNNNFNISHILGGVGGDTLYVSNGTAWIPLTGGNAPQAGTATYTKFNFSTTTTVLLDELGHSFAIPIGSAYNLNIRTLITGPAGDQPAVFVDELIIQGATSSITFHTILDSANVKTFTGGQPWTVTYALTGSVGNSTLTITVHRNSGPAPMNAISLVTFVQMPGSTDTSGP